MSWRTAGALLVYRAEIDVLRPDRNKRSDGTIGDPDHQKRNSDHNPWVPPPNGGVVTAMDITDDRGTLTMELGELLRKRKDKRVKYFIGERQMFSSYATKRFPAWTWRPYSGVNAHTSHSHLSIQAVGYDDKSPWGIADLRNTFIREEEDVLSQEQNGGVYSADVELWQYRLNQLGYNIEKDGYFGPQTAGAIESFQKRRRMDPTGVITLTTAVQLQAQAHLAANHS